MDQNLNFYPIEIADPAGPTVTLNFQTEYHNRFRKVAPKPCYQKIMYSPLTIQNCPKRWRFTPKKRNLPLTLEVRPQQKKIAPNSNSPIII